MVATAPRGKPWLFLRVLAAYYVGAWIGLVLVSVSIVVPCLLSGYTDSCGLYALAKGMKYGPMIVGPIAAATMLGSATVGTDRNQKEAE